MVRWSGWSRPVRILVAAVFLRLGAAVSGQAGKAASATTNGKNDQNGGWTSLDYPDIRAKPWQDQCGKHVPPFGYVCDPSSEAIISKQDAYLLNEMLIDLARTTKCKCQRRSQCMTKFHEGTPGGQVKVGFVVAVAFVNKLSSQGTVKQAAEKFSKIVRKRWGLGDCGNTALILIWEEHQFIHISADEGLTEFYLTDSEAEKIVAGVRDKIENKEYLVALEQILVNIKAELDGEPEKPIDIGILALGISSGVAMVVVGIITVCVCAFRCCGNLRNAPLKEVIERVEILRNELNHVARDNGEHRIGNHHKIQSSEDDLSALYMDGKHSLV